MPKTTFFLTAMALTALYLWRIHRTPHEAQPTATAPTGQPGGVKF